MTKGIAASLLVTVLTVGPALARSGGKAARAATPARAVNAALAPRAAGATRKPALASRVSAGGSLKPKEPKGLRSVPGAPALSTGSGALGKTKRTPN